MQEETPPNDSLDFYRFDLAFPHGAVVFELQCDDSQARLKGTVKLFFFFAEKGTFIIDKKRDVFNFFKFDP